MKKLIIAEKPSVTRELVKVIEGGAQKKGNYYEGDNYIFCNAVGHIMELMKPGEIDEKYKSWNLKSLPITMKEEIIDNFKISDKTKDIFQLIKGLVEREDVDLIINGCDPDREGELIFREVMDYIKSSKTIKRLVLKDMTEEGIKEQFAILETGESFEPLSMSAYGRVLSDYLVGLNLTRALTIKFGNGNILTAGRVQTPTLKLIYDRTKENLAHKKVITYQIRGTIKGTEIVLSLENKKFKTLEEGTKFLETLPSSLNIKKGKVKKSKTPPKLPSLMDVQKIGSKKFSYGAEKTLSIVQSLYETKKALTYPRTDCNFITEKTRSKLEGKLSNFSFIQGFETIKDGKLSKKVVGTVTAHEAITPTGLIPKNLSDEEKNIYREVTLIFLSNFSTDYLYNEISYEGIVAKEIVFKGKEKELIHKGYLDIYEDIKHKYLDEIEEGTYEMEYFVKEVETKPKPLFTEGTLIGKMENIHSDEEGESKKVLKAIGGLGTPATRGAIIENLFQRGFIEKKGKNSIVTAKKGDLLIELLLSIESKIVDVENTVILESDLKDISLKKMELQDYLEKNKEYVGDLMEGIISKESSISFPEADDFLGKCPKCGSNLRENSKAYGCSGYKEGCDFVIWKNIASKTISKKIAKELIKNGFTKAQVQGFKKKDGTSFDAKLKLDKNKKVIFFN